MRKTIVAIMTMMITDTLKNMMTVIMSMIVMMMQTSLYIYTIYMFGILPNLALDDLDDYDNDGDEDVDHSLNDDNNYDFDGKEDEDNDDSGDYDDASRLCIFFQTFALDNCSVFLQYEY